jgi:hypothetical protein
MGCWIRKKVSDANNEKLAIKLFPRTGLFTGSFLHPGSAKASSFAGVLYQNAQQPTAEGFYLSPLIGGIGYSGSVEIAP